MGHSYHGLFAVDKEDQVFLAYREIKTNKSQGVEYFMEDSMIIEVKCPRCEYE